MAPGDDHDSSRPQDSLTARASGAAMTWRASLLLLAVGAAGCRHADPADLVLRHGAIYPLASDSLRVETLAIRDGRVVYLGEDAGARRLIGGHTTVVELQGRMVLPAFRDTHLHPSEGVG